MKPQITTLPNQLRIVTAAMPQAYSAAISIAVKVGSRYERFEVNGGVSHFLEHLLFKGTKKRPSSKILSEQIDAVGGIHNAYTSNELTNYYVKVPYQHIGLAMDILADMVRNSLLEPEEVDRERNVVLEEINVYLDDPAEYVHRLTPKLLWPGHPLANEVIGGEEVIKAISRDAILDHYRTYYVPNNMVVCAAGRVDHDEIVKMAQELLGDMKPQKLVPAEPVGPLTVGDRVAGMHKDTAQVHLEISSVAYPYRHPNDMAARVITTILGHGASSRLFINVRERQGLAYSVGADSENFVDTGMFQAYAGVNTAKASKAVEAIIYELRQLVEKSVNDDELSKAKQQLRSGLQMSMESNSAVADRFVSQLLLLDNIRTMEQILADIDSVSIEDVRRVAAEMLAPDRLRFSVISSEPEEAIKTFEGLVQ